MTRKRKGNYKKRFIFLLLVGALVIIGLYSTKNLYQKTIVDIPKITKIQQLISPIPTQTNSFQLFSTSLFVPYWTLKNTEFNSPISLQDGGFKSQINTLIYFGITPTETEINKNEPGFYNLSTFSISKNSYRALLTIRMSNEDVTSTILENETSQKTIIQETLEIASQYDFDGIVLDLEHSVLPTSDIIQQITDFVETFSLQTKQQELTFGMTIYGDTYYRQRPYDLKALDQYVDQFYIMAYDFHKSYGEPGPNFPLKGKEIYGYDMEIMIRQLISDIDAQKLTILFGLFGYDWSVDDQNRPLKPAQSLTLRQIKNRFLESCPFTPCSIQRDNLSAETSIQYADETGQKHVVWFEDETSVGEKVTFLNSNSISNIGYWAWGYY